MGRDTLKRPCMAYFVPKWVDYATVSGYENMGSNVCNCAHPKNWTKITKKVIPMNNGTYAWRLDLSVIWTKFGLSGYLQDVCSCSQSGFINKFLFCSGWRFGFHTQHVWSKRTVVLIWNNWQLCSKKRYFLLLSGFAKVMSSFRTCSHSYLCD